MKTECMSDAVRIGSIIIFHVSKLRKAKFFILCGVMFSAVIVSGEEKENLKSIEIDHSWE